MPRSPMSRTGLFTGAARERRSWKSRNSSDCPSASWISGFVGESSGSYEYGSGKVKNTLYWLYFLFRELLYHNYRLCQVLNGTLTPLFSVG